MTGPAELGKTPFAVIDVEATGIYPGGHDRVIEVAVVRMGPGFQIEDEWVTLGNPRRDIGRTDIHGIQAADLVHHDEIELLCTALGHLLIRGIASEIVRDLREANVHLLQKIFELEINPNTVRSRLSRARDKLRAALAELANADEAALAESQLGP